MSSNGSTASRALAVLALAAAAAASSCGPRGVPPRPARPGDYVTLQVGRLEVEAELAFDGPSRTRGLMFREEMPENRGMLFLYLRKHKMSFWMKNTPLPLSIAFLTDGGEILQIEDMEPNDMTRIESKKEVRYALEVHQGWFRKAGVGVGYRLPGFEAKIRGIPVR